MNPFTTSFQAYVRWRHSRGFGVHSPFAYNIVKMAVRPGNYGYYGYEDIDRIILAPGFKGYPHSRSDARLLLRLLVTLRTRRLLVPEGLPAMRAAAEAAAAECVTFRAYDTPTALPSATEGDMLVAAPGTLSADIITRRISQGTSIFALSPDPDTIDRIYKACHRGLILHGSRLLIAIPREEMAFVAYTIKF